MLSVEFDGTCIGPTAGDLVPGSRRVEKKKKKKMVYVNLQLGHLPVESASGG